ncbi:hypothetical protein [Nitrospirillum viridazoti]|uniref:Uncharacterized protein n=1 Tax=Nitrospirillum viridazoti CBAmc TaxID=1441467 RepID=A0A248JX87_9PROT|nr:hypothetical protein [Nitrospirillum amazonense]ASG23333.1 hypothetical protein Y958_21205 [Nitrospirillum amazonense CBAmc]
MGPGRPLPDDAAMLGFTTLIDLITHAPDLDKADQSPPAPHAADWSFATPAHLPAGGSVCVDLAAGRVWISDPRRAGDFPLAEVAVQPIRPADIARPEALAQVVLWAGEPVPWRYRVPCVSWRQARTVAAELALVLERAAGEEGSRCLSF